MESKLKLVEFCAGTGAFSLVFEKTNLVKTIFANDYEPNSEKIFNDTGNLYLLSLGQIFVLLKKYKLDYVVLVKGQETIVEIKFKSESVSADDNASSEIKVINFAKFKKKENFT